MPAKTLMMSESDATDFERDPGLEFVRVPTEANARFRFQDVVLILWVRPSGAKRFAENLVSYRGIALAIPQVLRNQLPL
jgi:hypothetical protein